MRRGDVVDRQEQERTSDGSGSSALNRGGSTAKVQLLPLLEGSPDSDSQQQRPDRVRVPRLLDPLKLTAVATAAYGAIIFAGKRDARVNRRFFPESALVRSDDARVDPHLVAMNSFLGASFMSMGAVMGAMSFTSDRKLRRLFHFVNAAQIFFQQVVATRSRRRGFDEKQARRFLWERKPFDRSSWQDAARAATGLRCCERDEVCCESCSRSIVIKTKHRAFIWLTTPPFDSPGVSCPRRPVSFPHSVFPCYFLQANGALSIFLPLATWSLALFLGGGKKKKGAGKKKGSSDHDD